MSKFKGDSTQDFQFEGRFLGFATEAGSYKLKYLRIATATGEHYIKLPKEQRSLLYRHLTPGEWIEVTGYQKTNPNKGTTKLKAYSVSPMAAPSAEASTVPRSAYAAVPNSPVELAAIGSSEVHPSHRSKTKPACILVCQKSDCCKRGSREVAQALQSELRDRGLADQVTVRSTGCMKRCKEGANVVMPDKSRHSRVRPDKIAALVDQHFSETASAIAAKTA